MDAGVKFNYSIESTANFVINHSWPMVKIYDLEKLKESSSSYLKIKKYFECESDLKRHLKRLKILFVFNYKESVLNETIKRLLNPDLIMVAPICDRFFNLRDRYMFTLGKIFYTPMRIKLECLIFFDLKNDTLFFVHKTLDDSRLAEFISLYLAKYGLKQIEFKVGDATTETRYRECRIDDMDDYVHSDGDPLVIDTNNKFKNLHFHFTELLTRKRKDDYLRTINVKLNKIKKLLKQVKYAYALNVNKENEYGLEVDICKIVQDVYEKIILINNEYMMEKVKEMSEFLCKYYGDAEDGVSPAKKRKMNAPQPRNVEESQPRNVYENSDDFDPCHYTYPPISCMFNFKCDRSLDLTTLMIFSKNSLFSPDYADDDDKNTQRIEDIKKLIKSKNFKMFKPFLKRQYQ
uniref:Uncharacterized protein n=1 Tax=Spodoptera littoralis nuclear polyhedrosis virus TaxID=10456 RepID=A0A3G4S8S7_NPVSL|nr:hypothetical protein [Spodoptera littoralis nucleopolyhedrovirus]